MIALSWLVAFLFAVGIDFAYARWFISVAERRRAPACFFSACVTVLGFLSVLVCLDTWSAIVPAAVGHALGTWIAMGKGEGKKDGT